MKLRKLSLSIIQKLWKDNWKKNSKKDKHLSKEDFEKIQETIKKVDKEIEENKEKDDFFIESEEGIYRYLEKQNRYTGIQAELLTQSGKKVGIIKLIVSPVFRFIKFYLLRQGFRDGIPGLIHIVIGCMNSFVKYAKVYEKQITKYRWIL